MSQAKKTSGKAAASKAAAARSEKKTKSRELEFRGVKVTLPPELPASAAFAMEKAAGEPNFMKASMVLLRGLIGRSTFDEIEAVVFDDPSISMGDLDGLVSDIFGQYGVTSGESEASDAS